ncbi:FecR family protein [Chitinophaga alhagiae]|uniref:FecR family protein n=1 Tax=Chitinophaga alhagiae TaxID=2203219 RepID=UPI000E5B35AA|nr:FecR domain-containing protein [Chitinophaga alhagiae]
MSDQQLLQLLEKYLRNECTEEEREAVEGWYHRYGPLREPARPTMEAGLQAVYHGLVEQLREEGEWRDEGGLRPEAPPVRRLYARWWKAAAAVLLVAGAAWWLLRPAPMVLAVTAPGQRTQIMLPDSTRVWLNVSSRLEYPRHMEQGGREVYLRGEAYFEVAANAQHPFLVRTDDIQVQVLGTAFNLKAYREDGALETTLVEGKVAVNLRGGPERRQVLAPGEKLLLTRKTAASTGEGEDWGAFTASLQPASNGAEDNEVGESMWRKERLQFKDQSFTELARVMERWYNRRIVIRDAALNENRFSGEFRNEDITRALKALQLTADFTYELKGDTVFITQ